MFQIAVTDAKALVDDQWRLMAGVAHDLFFEYLADQVAQLGNAHYRTVILLHEALDVAFHIVAVEAEQPGHLGLVFQQQAVFAAAGQHVQGIAYPPQKGTRAGQQLVFAAGEKARCLKAGQCLHAEAATGNPHDGLQVAQPAGRALHIRLEIVFGVVIAFVTVALLVTLAEEKVAAAPHVQRTNGFGQLCKQLLVTTNKAAFQQVGDYAEIIGRFFTALCQRTYAMADLQPEIPQEGDELADGIGQRSFRLVLQQDQQIDVRMGVQLATAVTANCHQGNSGCVTFQTVLLPCLLQQLVNHCSAGGDQLIDVMAVEKTLIQHQAGMFQCLAEDGPGLCVTAEALAERFAVKQLKIGRHGCYQGPTAGKVSSLRRVKIS